MDDADHGLVTGDKVDLTVLAGSLGIDPGTYYVVRVDENRIQLAASWCLAGGICTDADDNTVAQQVLELTPAANSSFTLALTDLGLSESTRYTVDYIDANAFRLLDGGSAVKLGRALRYPAASNTRIGSSLA